MVLKQQMVFNQDHRDSPSIILLLQWHGRGSDSPAENLFGHDMVAVSAQGVKSWGCLGLA